MKTQVKRIASIVMVVLITLIWSTQSYATYGLGAKSEVSYSKRLLSISQHLKIRELKKAGYTVDKPIFHVEGKDFIRFRANDTVGLMHLDGIGYSTLIVEETNFGSRTTYETRKGEKTVFDLDHEGNLLPNISEKSWEGFAYDLATSGIAGIYGLAATAIAGPIAGGIVATVTKAAFNNIPGRP